MHLDRDEIVEALLLGPADNGPRMSPKPEEEALLLGDEPEPQEGQEATTFHYEQPEIPKPKEPAEQSDTPSTVPPSATVSDSSLETPEEHSTGLDQGILQSQIH